MKKLITNVLFLFAMTTLLAQNPVITRAPIVQQIIGPTGALINPPSTTPQSISCVVNGVTITTSGTTSYLYVAPIVAANGTCQPLAPYVGQGNWTGTSPNGTVTYTFSQPILSARVAYCIVNNHDFGTLTSNSTSPIQLFDPCGLTVNNNVINGNFAIGDYGNVSITVSSVTPFTTLTLTNTGGQSGWANGNPCNFIINPSILGPSPTIVNCSKLELDRRNYSTGSQSTTKSVFTAATGGGCPQATINGVPCTASNVTIEAVTPLASGCTFNTNGTIQIAAGILPFGATTYYRLRSIANSNIYSQNYKVSYGMNNRVFPGYDNNIFTFIVNAAGTGTINSYVNGDFSVFAGSKINSATDGTFNPIPANLSNVTITNLPGSGSPYFTINAAGKVVYTGTPVPLPVTPGTGTQYWVNYSMCLPGSTVFCATGSFTFYYEHPFNRHSNSTTNLDTLLVAPNPSSDGVYQLTFDQTVKEATLEVHRLTGEKVHTQKLQDTNKEVLVLDKLPKGIYVLKVITNDQTVSKKISKE
jgi:Secretion system C-terminal sorting domain